MLQRWSGLWGWGQWGDMLQLSVLSQGGQWWQSLGCMMLEDSWILLLDVPDVQKCFNPTTDAQYGPPLYEGCAETSEWSGTKSACLCSDNLCNGSSWQYPTLFFISFPIIASRVFWIFCNRSQGEDLCWVSTFPSEGGNTPNICKQLGSSQILNFQHAKQFIVESCVKSDPKTLRYPLKIPLNSIKQDECVCRKYDFLWQGRSNKSNSSQLIF